MNFYIKVTQQVKPLIKTQVALLGESEKLDGWQ